MIPWTILIDLQHDVDTPVLYVYIMDTITHTVWWEFSNKCVGASDNGPSLQKYMHLITFKFPYNL